MANIGRDSNGTLFPSDFPLPESFYTSTTTAAAALNNPTQPTNNNDNTNTRTLTTFYDLSLLTSQPSTQSQAPLSLLRQAWQTKFQRTANGAWHHVEYVPAWTDPDWDARYVFLNNNNNDPMAAQYAKPGILQTQRPALRAGDEIWRPTEAATRFGFDPFLFPGAVSSSSSSGVTPRLRLEEGERHALRERARRWRAQFEAWYARQNEGRQGGERRFREYLQRLVVVGDGDEEKRELARRVLGVLGEEERVREEWQRFLLLGNTSLELVEKRVWNIGEDAEGDLDAPLHDLVTLDKWADTSHRGQSEDTPRVVYDIDGKQGEYSMYDPHIRAALQPTLQLVSHVLATNHPSIFAWADVRRYHPVTDHRNTLANDPSKHLASLHPSFSLSSADLPPEWTDLRALCDAGFDSTRYVCGVLRHTIQWAILPKYRAGVDSVYAYGATSVEAPAVSDANNNNNRVPPPYRIQVVIAADYIWPLLVGGYSAAEKASASFVLATVMLHELAHAMRTACLQLGAPWTTTTSNNNNSPPPHWVLFEPAWRGEIEALSARTGVDVFAQLESWGRRWRVDEVRMSVLGAMWTDDECFVANQPQAEEGFAAEEWCWGGIIDGISVNTQAADLTRFLSETITMCSWSRWETLPITTTTTTRRVPTALPRAAYLRLFQKAFWQIHHARMGPSALLLHHHDAAFPPPQPQHYELDWTDVETVFGEPARRWLQLAWRRVRGYDQDDAAVFLWRWLYARLQSAVEGVAVERRLEQVSRTWSVRDAAAWRLQTSIQRHWDALVTAFFNLDTAAPPPTALMQAFFTALTAALRFFAHEAAILLLQTTTTTATVANITHQRLQAIHLPVLARFTAFLTFFTDPSIFSPTVASWLRESDDDKARHLLDNDLPALCDLARTTQRQFENILNNNLQQRQAPDTTTDNSRAERLQAMARWQWTRLEASDPRRGVATQWFAILNGSSGADGDAVLGAQADRVERAVEAAQEEARSAVPDRAGGGGRAVTLGGLVEEQPDTDPQVLPLSGVYNNGYQAYVDPNTGFTHFEAQQQQQQQQVGMDAWVDWWAAANTPQAPLLQESVVPAVWDVNDPAGIEMDYQTLLAVQQQQQQQPQHGAAVQDVSLFMQTGNVNDLPDGFWESL